jgi:hypothetical protein
MENKITCNICFTDFKDMELMAFGCCAFRCCKNCFKNIQDDICPMCRKEFSFFTERYKQRLENIKYDIGMELAETNNLNLQLDFENHNLRDKVKVKDNIIISLSGEMKDLKNKYNDLISEYNDMSLQYNELLEEYNDVYEENEKLFNMYNNTKLHNKKIKKLLKNTI